MLAGTCAGVTGTGDCVRSGFSPYWLPPIAFADRIEGLLSSLDEIVCPFCITERAVGVIPGFNRAKADRVIAALSALNCMQPGNQPSPGHTHLFDWVAEDMANLSRNTIPQPGERGY